MQQLSQKASESQTYTVEFRDEVAPYWVAGRHYDVNEFMRLPGVFGYHFVATNASQSGASQPDYNPTVGQTFADGGISWRTELATLESLDAIASAEIPDVAGLTISVVEAEGSAVRFNVSGGEVRRLYVIAVSITTEAGNRYKAEVELYISGS